VWCFELRSGRRIARPLAVVSLLEADPLCHGIIRPAPAPAYYRRRCCSPPELGCWPIGMTARPGPGCGPLLAALLAVLQGQARALQTTRSKPLVRMGYFQESQPFAVACARGWLNTVEYDVGCFPQSSGDYAVSKLDSGDLDLAQLGSTPIAVSNARGVDVVSFQMAHDSSHSQGMCTKGGGGPMSLLGKRIACPFGSTAHFHMLFLLSELGLPVCPGAQRAPHPGCVALENMSPSALIAAWDADKIDGGFVWGHAFVHMRTHGGTAFYLTGGFAIHLASGNLQ
jgi:ABC-type taurine transport system substrate-binding protein